MGIAHSLGIGHQLRRHLIIGEIRSHAHVQPIHVALPASQMHLEDVQGAGQVVRARASGDPVLIEPLVGIRVCGHGGGAGNLLGGKAIGIGLEEGVSRQRGDRVLVELADTDVRHEALPDAGVDHLVQGVGTYLPPIEVADDTHRGDVWRPHVEVVANHPVVMRPVRAHLLVTAEPLATAKPVSVIRRQDVIGVGQNHDNPFLERSVSFSVICNCHL